MFKSPKVSTNNRDKAKQQNRGDAELPTSHSSCNPGAYLKLCSRGQRRLCNSKSDAKVRRSCRWIDRHRWHGSQLHHCPSCEVRQKQPLCVCVVQFLVKELCSLVAGVQGASVERVIRENPASSGTRCQALSLKLSHVSTLQEVTRHCVQANLLTKGRSTPTQLIMQSWQQTTTSLERLVTFHL